MAENGATATQAPGGGAKSLAAATLSRPVATVAPSAAMHGTAAQGNPGSDAAGTTTAVPTDPGPGVNDGSTAARAAPAARFRASTFGVRAAALASPASLARAGAASGSTVLHRVAAAAGRDVVAALDMYTRWRVVVFALAAASLVGVAWAVWSVVATALGRPTEATFILGSAVYGAVQIVVQLHYYGTPHLPRSMALAHAAATAAAASAVASPAGNAGAAAGAGGATGSDDGGDVVRSAGTHAALATLLRSAWRSSMGLLVLWVGIAVLLVVVVSPSDASTTAVVVGGICAVLWMSLPAGEDLAFFVGVGTIDLIASEIHASLYAGDFATSTHSSEQLYQAVETLCVLLRMFENVGGGMLHFPTVASLLATAAWFVGYLNTASELEQTAWGWALMGFMLLLTLSGLSRLWVVAVTNSKLSSVRRIVRERTQSAIGEFGFSGVAVLPVASVGDNARRQRMVMLSQSSRHASTGGGDRDGVGGNRRKREAAAVAPLIEESVSADAGAGASPGVAAGSSGLAGGAAAIGAASSSAPPAAWYSTSHAARVLLDDDPATVDAWRAATWRNLVPPDDMEYLGVQVRLRDIMSGDPHLLQLRVLGLVPTRGMVARVVLSLISALGVVKRLGSFMAEVGLAEGATA